ncbi:MAG: hypothetical protein OCD76_13225 [Reichenbachiella sp.]
MNNDNITKINEVIVDYFDNNKKVKWVAAREIMPGLVAAGVFNKDVKKGMPLRKVLRELDENNELEQIPRIHAERKGVDTYWYLVREGHEYVSKDPNDLGVVKSQKRKLDKINSDQSYLINLCDEVLELSSSRDHKFGFLLGDANRDGMSRSILPVDAYYHTLSLAIEFTHRALDDKDYSEKEDRLTNSGVTRSEQRKIYSERKIKGLRSNEKEVAVIDYSSFKIDKQGKIVRDLESDKKILKGILIPFKEAAEAAAANE